MSDEQNNVIPVSTASKETKAKPVLDVTLDAFDKAKLEMSVAYDELKKVNHKAIAKIQEAEAEIEKGKAELEKQLKAFRKSHNIEDAVIGVEHFMEHLKEDYKKASKKVSKSVSKTAKKVTKSAKKASKKVSKAASSTKAIALQKAEACMAVLSKLKNKEIKGPDYRQKVAK